MGRTSGGVQFCGSPWLWCGEWIPALGKAILAEKLMEVLAGSREVLI